jgi:hypothetical protein
LVLGEQREVLQQPETGMRDGNRRDGGGANSPNYAVVTSACQSPARLRRVEPWRGSGNCSASYVHV